LRSPSGHGGQNSGIMMRHIPVAVAVVSVVVLLHLHAALPGKMQFLPLSPPEVRELSVRLKSSSVVERLKAIEAVRELKTSWPAAELKGILQNAKEEPIVRDAAADSLLVVAPSRALPHLRVIIGNSEEPESLRLNAIRRLVAHKDWRSISLLATLIEDREEREAIRLEAIKGISNFLPVRVTAPLLIVAQDKAQSLRLRTAATTALGRSGDRRVLPALLTLLEEPNVELVRSAVTAVGDISRTSRLWYKMVFGGTAVEAPELVDKLKKVIDSYPSRPVVRKDGVIAISRLWESQQAMDVLIDILNQDPNQEVKIAAIAGLGNFSSLQTVQALHALQRIVGNPRHPAPVRASAVVQLGRLAERTREYGGLAAIKRLAKRGTELERRSAVVALGSIGHQDAASVLIGIVKSKAQPDRFRALALRGLKRKTLINVPQLEGFLPTLGQIAKRKKEKEEVRVAAIDLLGNFPDNQKELLAIVKDSTNAEPVRQTALSNLDARSLSMQDVKKLNTVFSKETNRRIQREILRVLEKGREAYRKLLRVVLTETQYDIEVKFEALQGLVRQLSTLMSGEREVLMNNLLDKSKDAALREKLIMQLGSLNTSSVSDQVARGVAEGLLAIGTDRAESNGMRLAALSAAGAYLHRGNGALAASLLSLVASKMEDNVLRVRAARMLPKVKAKYDRQLLVTIVKDETESPNLRAAALEGVVASSVARNQVADMLLELAQNDAQLEVREAAVGGLSEFAKDERVFEFLKALVLESGGDEVMRTLAVLGLYRGNRDKARKHLDEVRHVEKSPLVQWAITLLF